MIKIGLKGVITNGRLNGWYILVQDDSENTGGYLVIQSPQISFDGEGFDNWFETMDEVQQFFQNNNWSVEWFE